MILGHKKRAPEDPKPAGGYVLEFEDLWSEDHKLRDWLKTATTGLVAPAKQRIRTEIEAHYRQAVAAHVADGLSEARAKTAAVAELGDSIAAWKRFRRTHLTTADAMQAARWLKWAGSVWWLLSMYLIFSFVLYMERDLAHEKRYLAPSVYFPVGFLALVVVPTVCFVLARRRSPKPNTRLIVLMQSGAFYAWMLCLFFSTDGPSYWFLVMCLWFAGCMLFRPLRIWYKLRRAGDDWSEMPPRNAASP
ncbi:MAG: hypothetical protein ABSA12_15345 [Verrucomicrobiia bacterium]